MHISNRLIRFHVDRWKSLRAHRVSVTARSWVTAVLRLLLDGGDVVRAAFWEIQLGTRLRTEMSQARWIGGGQKESRGEKKDKLFNQTPCIRNNRRRNVGGARNGTDQWLVEHKIVLSNVRRLREGFFWSVFVSFKCCSLFSQHFIYLAHNASLNQ